MDEKQAAYAKYQKEKEVLTKVEKALDLQKERCSNSAKEILASFGKGPHDLGDGVERVVAVRNGTYFFMPIKKGPRKKGQAPDEDE